MDSTSSRIYMSPSFNRNSSNDIADIADRVVQELRIQNGFQNDDVFIFSDDDNPAAGYLEVINSNSHTEEVDEDEQEFEFPVVCKDSHSASVSDKDLDSAGEVFSSEQIPLRYPVFDTSLLSEISNSINPEPDTKAAPSTRSSLKKLFSEDRDTSSTSSSETDELDGVTPGTYCVWKPMAKTKEPPRGKHKKSNSMSINNISKRWKVRDLLKRSYSDDNYSTGKESPVVVFLPPISPKQKSNAEKVNKIEKTGKVSGGGGGSGKTERNIPAYRTKIGNIRIPPYLPYRQDQVAAFGNFNGSSANIYRY